MKMTTIYYSAAFALAQQSATTTPDSDTDSGSDFFLRLIRGIGVRWDLISPAEGLVIFVASVALTIMLGFSIKNMIVGSVRYSTLKDSSMSEGRRQMGGGAAFFLGILLLGIIAAVFATIWTGLQNA